MGADGNDLFGLAPEDKDRSASEPLAARMRPRVLDDFVGQEHIVGPGRLLRRAIQKDRLSSLILSGPPGTGKTTLARVIANGTSARFVAINAVLAGVQAIRDAIDEAKRARELYDRRTILFVDEVHRWNKAQQDALLPWVENGTIVLVGATTENPFFEVNRALVSRSRVFLLKALDAADLLEVARRALSDRERGYGRWKVEFAEGALEHLVDVADGDARSLLNALELAVETSHEPWPPPEGATVSVTMEAAEESIQRRAVLYDKDGDYHYDSISAFIKSLRGSDPDAALYWMARMVYAGEDPAFIFRRMLISAAEDVGLADPRAVEVVDACARAFERIGFPEGQFHMAEAALYLATAPKSNSALAYFDALAEVEKSRAEVPLHLKDGSRDGPGFGHGDGYRYPHAYRDHWTAQQYLPELLRGRVFYKPGALGHEGSVRETVLARREEQLVAALDEAQSRVDRLTYSKEADRSLEWLARASGGSTALARAARDGLHARAAIQRHERVLVVGERDGLALREAIRKAPEGACAALVQDARAAEVLEAFAAGLEELMRPTALVGDPAAPDRETMVAAFGFASFDVALFRDVLARRDADEAGTLLDRWREALPEARMVFAETLAGSGGRLSLIPGVEAELGAELATRFARFEDGFYGFESGDVDSAAAKLRKLASLRPGATIETSRVETERAIPVSRLDAWLSPEGPYGAALSAAFGASELDAIAAALRASTSRGPVPWPGALAFLALPSAPPRG
ncbi:MAG: AAA family ATPase [Spirochaetales bacterium]|nr:AAA family ATPase [Spirochaetales bacterium]